MTVQENIEKVSSNEQLLTARIKQEINEILKNDEEFKDYTLECIMIDKNNVKKSYGIAIYFGDIAFIDIYKKEINEIIDAETTFDVGEDNIFQSLEEGMKIGYMSMGMHYALWLEVSSYYLEDTKYKNGMQEYLKYCKINNITKETIDKAFINKSPYEFVPDAMKHYTVEKNKKNRDVR